MPRNDERPPRPLGLGYHLPATGGTWEYRQEYSPGIAPADGISHSFRPGDYLRPPKVGDFIRAKPRRPSPLGQSVVAVLPERYVEACAYLAEVDRRKAEDLAKARRLGPAKIHEKRERKERERKAGAAERARRRLEARKRQNSTEGDEGQ
jgi:hypothetical protein